MVSRPSNRFRELHDILIKMFVPDKGAESVVKVECDGVVL